MANYLNIFRICFALMIFSIVEEPTKIEASSDNKESYQINGRVTDEQGQPVYDADVSTFWWSKNGKMVPVEPSTTDIEGKFTISIWLGPKKIAALMVMDKNHSYGGIRVLNSTNIDKFQDIKLRPSVTLMGEFFDKKLDQSQDGTRAYIIPLPGLNFEILSYREETREMIIYYTFAPLLTQLGVKIKDGPPPMAAPIAMNENRESKFTFRLPPGKYLFGSIGEHVSLKPQVIELDSEEYVSDLQKVYPTKLKHIARFYGKKPPLWNVTAARGIKKDVKLSDFKGKWLLLEFWGYWCGPCVGSSLPRLMNLYETHKDKRDQFEILAFHDASVKNFQELDKHLKSIISSKWNGKMLPFPILLDSTRKTIKNYGINSFPTLILIDPKGRVVPGGDEHELAEKLGEM